MKEFLAYVAQDIIEKYGTDLTKVAVVFPNKRASLFLNEHLARLSDKPLWSPAYITISELFRQQSALLVADPIKQVCDLHKSFCAVTASQETLDKFYGWGQLLLSDFDDIDKNMADADRVFANLRDIHELDDISYLTDEQREMIRRFFSNFSEEHNTELKERFLRLWSHFADIYHDFNERLSAQGLAYEGSLYRLVTTRAEGKDFDLQQAFPYDHYLFVGFNLLQKVEQRLFSRLQQAGKAHFYWDFDKYYIQHHEAGQYIAQYLKYFPNELPTDDAGIYDSFRHPKQIRYIAAPTENIQAHYVSSWLREQGSDGKMRLAGGRRTAIILCNEGLLQTVIHCLPNEVDKINVTTGYPLSQTPIASFIQLYFNLCLGGHSPRLCRLYQRHPYSQYADEAASSATGATSVTSIVSRLLGMVRSIARNAKDAIHDPLFQESLFRAYTLLNRVNGLVDSGDLVVDDITMQRLIGQLIQQTSIPFHGEPVEGIQVMGVLETRNLDFDHVLVLSCNEGNLPRGVNDSSFIPHSIRHAYELTTVDNKVSIYAYYYHRLLQRASDVTILYNNSTENGQQGEMSRFMLQMTVDYGHSIGRYTLQSGQSLVRWHPIPIEKTPHVCQLLEATFSSRHSAQNILSPTAINKYMRCPLQFYYRYVADIKEPDQPDDEQELDNRIFGNIFHEAADMVYKQLPQHVNREILVHLLKSKATIERAVDEAFRKELPYAAASGLQLINREVIIHYLRQLMEIDLRLAPFSIMGLEHDVQRPLVAEGPGFCVPLNIGGRIDRLDMMNDDSIRVVDYKTGSRRLKPLPDVEAIFLPENIHEHSDYYLQTFIYADIVRRNGSLPVVPALLFIQHAGADDYDPALCFGKERIHDVADHTARFNELLSEKINEMFNPAIPFTPTSDLRVCRSCPYQQLCRR